MQVCLICKIPLKQNSLCAWCGARLIRLRKPVTRDEGDYRVRALFPWRESSPPALRWMVQSLKEKDWAGPWRELAALMLNSFGPLPPSVFVPIPSRRRNHALGLAMGLSEWTSYPVMQALGQGEVHQQKTLTRDQRFEVSFEREIWTYCTEYTNVVIVDDVVTTGATARAAYSALGRPKLCEVWCLLDRRPCGS